MGGRTHKRLLDLEPDNPKSKRCVKTLELWLSSRVTKLKGSNVVVVADMRM
jgi:hypothetical protein